MDDLVEILHERGITSDIDSNSYSYSFTHNHLNIELIVQSNYHGYGRIVGHALDLKISKEKEYLIIKQINHERIINFPDRSYITNFVNRFNYREFCINGSELNGMIDELLNTIDMKKNDYIKEIV